MKRIFLLTVVTIASSALFSQTHEAETWQLSSQESGNKNYVARESIRLQPGFHYTAGSGQTFRASIDPRLVFAPTANTYALPDGTITDDPAEGGVVGAIPGQFAVSPTGAATYTVPIEAPMGINGMQPNIALVYNSQSGNGIAGWGWNISGISAIGITSKNIFSDDAIHGVNLTGALHLQKFTMDGNTLILTNGTTGTKTYITENKSYLQIIHDNTKFIITAKDGSIMEYAQQIIPHKIATGQSNAQAFQWLLTKVKDVNGNYITYNYISNDAGTQTVLDNIEYTGTDSLTATLKVQFEYESKTVTKKQYICGYYLEDYYLLKNMIVSSNSVQLRKYELTHNYSDEKYFLTDISLIGENNERLNATTMEWGEKNDSILVNTATINNPSYSFSEVTRRAFTASDINGDGIADLMEFFNRKLSYNPGGTVVCADGYCYKDYIQINKLNINNDTIEYGQILSSQSIGASFDHNGFKNIDGNPYLVSFTGNQKKRIVVPKYFENDDPYIKEVTLLDAARGEAGGIAALPLNLSSQLPAMVTGDINNDGIDEIIIIEKVSSLLITDEITNQSIFVQGGGASVIYTKKNNFTTEYFTSPDQFIVDSLPFNPGGNFLLLCPKVKEAFLFDFNADGLKDLFLLTSLGGIMLKNNGGEKGADGIVHVSFTQLSDTYTSLALNDTESAMKSGDFNGDGLLDFLRYNGENGFTIHYGNGNFGFTSSSVSGISLVEDTCNGARENTRNDSRDDYIIFDFNHDGKSDLIVIDANYHEECGGIFCLNPWCAYDNTTIKWYASTGTGFSLAKSVTSTNQDYYFKGYATVGDFDGDGYEDLFSYGSNLYTGNAKSDNGYFYTSFNTNFEAHQVKSITDGMGNTTEIAYQPLTFAKKPDGTDFYTKGTTAVYPVADLQVPFNCVREVTNNSFPTGYSYSNAKVQLTGKGFLGFTGYTAQNLTDSTKTVSTTEMNYEYCLPDKQKSQVIAANNMVVAATESQFTNSKSGKVYTSLPSKTIEINCLADSLTKTTEYLMYDAYGNLLKYKATQGNLIEKDSITYIQKGSWCLNKPQTITKIRTYNNLSDTIQTAYAYDNKGNLTSETLFPNNNAHKVITQYSNFDAFGHPRTVSVKAKDKNSTEQTRTTSQTYTPSGRFVATKTNVLGEITTYHWNETRGLLDYETDHYGRTTHYTYDSWGSLKETRFPDGARHVQSLQWAGNTSGKPAGAKYYAYSESSGNAPAIVWFNNLGREIRKDTRGLNNLKTCVTTEYYTSGKNKGRLHRISEPYFESAGNSMMYAATYLYDKLGRDSIVTTPMGQTRTGYNGLSTTLITPEGTKTTVLNTSGFLAHSIVNGDTVSYAYYPNGLTKTATPKNGTALAMEYDLHGNRTKLIDPDAGEILTRYNGFGELVEEKQKIHNASYITTSYNYAPATGLLNTSVRNSETKTYTYDTNSGHPGRLRSIEITGKHKQTFSYDDLSRVIDMKDELDGKTFHHQTEYDVFGRIKKEIYPTGYYAVNHYDKNGFLTKITDSANRHIWEATAANARGQITHEKKSNQITDYYYDSRGLPSYVFSNGGLDNMYEFDTKGNQVFRDNYTFTPQTESFVYDNKNRLTDWLINDNVNHSMTYGSQGNIETKTDLGDYTMNYGANGKPHALTSINGFPDNFPNSNLSITYTNFKKVKTLSEDNKFYEISYGVDEQRIKSVYKLNNAVKKTRYYLGDYEEEIDALGNTRKIHYLRGAILIQNNGTDSLLYCYNDLQGSLTALTSENGNIVERYAYDPWGNRRNPDNWEEADTRTSFLINRGYTMHEHIDEFGLINMNGRMYDPLTAQFLSPDPYVQSPDNWLNYNRYGYCLNNPFKYTDPTGEWFGIDDLLIAGAGFVIGYVGHGLSTGNWGWNAVAAGGMGAGMAWLGYNTAGLATGAITNATWNQVGSMAINAVANQIMPPMYIPLGDHFGIGISPAFGLGASGLTGGFNMTGVYTNGDLSISAGIGAGDNYWGWNDSAMDTRTGYGGGYGQTTYGSAEVMGQQFKPQRVGTYTAFFNHNSFSISNDLWGDKGDRQRTSAAELTIGKWSVGTYLYTNDGRKASAGAPDLTGGLGLDDSPNCIPPAPVGLKKSGKRETWWNGRPYSAPFWVGYRNGNQITRVGFSHQIVHNLTQNMVHKFMDTPYYMTYDEFRTGGYFYTGYRNPLSLWDR